MAGIKPTLQALLVADHVYQDKLTGKYVICGVFGTILRRQPPKKGQPVKFGSTAANTLQAGFNAETPFAFLSLVDVDGEQKFELRYVRLHDDVVIFQAEVTVTSPNRLLSVPVSVPLPKLPQDVGTYALEILWNSVEPLGAYRIAVIMEEQTGDPS